MIKYIIYKTTNKINGKIYIGVHRTRIDIDDGYRGCGMYSTNDKKKVKRGLCEAIHKYGIENFVRETLFEYEDSEKGKIQAYKKEAELVNRDFLKRKDVYNLCLGGKVPSSINEKEVAQYDLDGNFIKSYYSITYASNVTGISQSGITNTCSGDIKYCSGFQWRYFNGNTDSINAVQVKEKPVFQFDLQGNYIEYYKSIAEAARITNISRENIRAVCNGKRNQAGGYYWNLKKRFDYNPHVCTAVACYTDEGKFIKSYTSVKEAAIDNNITDGSLCSCIKGRTKHCAKLRWRYFYGNTSDISPL